MKNFKLFLLPLFFLFLVINYNFVFSQDKKDDKRSEMRKRWDKLEELKKLKMLEELNLSEEESFKFYSRYISFRNQMREIEKERHTILNDLENVVKSGNQQDIAKKIEEVEAIDQKMFENRKIFIQDIKKIISINKTAKYILFERNFQREIQNILKDIQKSKVRWR